MDEANQVWPPDGWVEPEETIIDVGSVKLGALVYGEASAPPVLLLHGWADSAWSMETVAQALASKNHVVSLDLRGHGRSGRGPYSMTHLIADLANAIEVLELGKPVIIGHSLGGQVSAQFCGLYPDIPRALILIEGVGPPPHRLSESDPDRLERRFAHRQVERVRRPTRSKPLPNLEVAVERFRAAHPALTKARATHLTEKATQVGDDGQLSWRFDPDTRDWFNGHNHDVAEQRWRGITCPTLVIVGSQAHRRFWQAIGDDADDYPAPLTGEALADRLSNFADVEHAEIAGAGHMIAYDTPDELDSIIAEFWSTRLANNTSRSMETSTVWSIE